MKNKIKESIDNAEQLEMLYRADKKSFEKSFFEVFPEISHYELSHFWKTRLEFNNSNTLLDKNKKKDVLLFIIACAVTVFLIQLPNFFEINLYNEPFFLKNAGLIVFFGLSFYVFLTRGLFKAKQLLITLAIFIITAVYINMLPSDTGIDTVNLAFLHLPLMLWCLYGLVFIDFDASDMIKRINYIKYNGELVVLGAVILIAGGVLTAVTLSMFTAIELNIEQFYTDYIVVSGLVCVPIVATYIIRLFPFVANKIAPVIANIFSPLVLITLISYLISIFITGKDPYNDRDFLITFNLMLLGVMLIVVFSISGTSINKRQRFNEITLLVLVVVALVVDLIALSAILYRMGEFGFTPNRIVVLGSNLLIFVNLLLIMIDLFRVNFKNKELKDAEITIAKYLPIYAFWTIFVVFILPWIFGIK